MNICVITPDKDVYSETFIRAHINGLPGNISFLYGGSFPKYMANGQPLLQAPSFLQRVQRSLLSRIFKVNFDEDTLRHKALCKFLKNNKIDAVLAEYGPTAAYVMNACQEVGVALIPHFHGYDAYEYATLKKFDQQYKKLFQLAAAIVVVSKHMEKQLISLGAPADKIHCAPCGMDPKIFHGSNPSQMPPIFLSTGRFVDKKAPHLTLLAFQRVLAQVPEAQLIMVGDGPLFDSCISLTDAFKIEKSVRFVGVQPHTQVAKLMREVRAFVQHSLIPRSGDSEGTPVAVQEAGGSGLPVISTYHAGIPDVIQDGVTGFLVKEGDVEAMADRMIRVAQNPQLAAKLGEAAQKRILSGFTVDQSVGKLADIIKIVIDKKQNQK